MKKTAILIIPALAACAQTLSAEGTRLLRLTTREPGMYRLTAQAMADAGLDPERLDPRTLNLQFKGTAVPIALEDAEESGFGPDAAILFYGAGNTGAARSLDRWQEERCYFLVSGAGEPVRFTSPARSATPPPPLRSGALRRRTRIEASYITPYFNDDEKDPFDFFVTAYMSPGTPTWGHGFAVPGLDVEADVLEFKARFYGRSSVAANPDHIIHLGIGGAPVEEATFDGIAGFTYVNAAIPTSAAASGRLDVKIEIGKPSLAGKAAIDNDTVMLDWCEVEYPAVLDAGSGPFEAFASAANTETVAATATVKGLRSASVSVFDLGNGARPLLDVRPTGEGFEATFEFAVDADTHLVVTPNGEWKSPSHVAACRPSTFAEDAGRAELVIVAPPEFQKDAERLAAVRREQGMEAAVALTTEIYDEHGHGHKSPAAIRAFLKSAHEASGSLRYVLLAGSASQDPKGVDFRSKDNPDYVPAMYYGSSRFAPFSWDNYYVAFTEGDETPTVAVGRVPARTPGEFSAYVDKIIAYESFESPEWMNGNVLLCSVEQNLVEALESTAKIVTDYNSDARFERVYADPKLEDTIYAPKAVAAIDEGAGLVVFNGHGASQRWGQGPIGREPRRFLFDLQAVNELQNQNRYPIVLAATCYTNGFDDPRGGETIGRWWMMRPDGGGIAVVAPTHRVYLHEGNHLLNEFTTQLFSPEGTDRLGDAFLEAQKKMLHPEVRATMTLLGDPSLKIAALRSTVDADYAERKAAEAAAKAKEEAEKAAAAAAAAAAATPTPTPSPTPADAGPVEPKE